jgi:iron(II)-dependent oxidoreductase
MVCVPAGEFLMGSTNDDPGAHVDEEPRHTVYLDAFWIDKTEVTNAQYRQCVEAGACWELICWDDPDLNAPDQPAVCVTWEDAGDYAAWVGGRLPTEAEWEKACRGTDRRFYPWGNSLPNCDRANHGDCVGHSVAVGSYLGGASPYGVLNMAGNAAEWVADGYLRDYYSQSPARNPRGPESEQIARVWRGGHFSMGSSVPESARCANREIGWGSWKMAWVGFRVAVAP